MKCGVEEYEILRALSRKDKSRADGICRKVLRTFDEYIDDVAEFDRISADLVSAFDETE
jgi:hypothetical protein